MRLTQDQIAQILPPPVRRIMELYRAAGGEARVVGGAVRDALLGRALGDVDLAATLPPEEGQRVLAAAGIKTVPTGLAFGTITAVIDGKGFEITTLRRDVATDGRHAEVAFDVAHGADWPADAARRDFTINALYMDEHGEVFDYGAGLQDLGARLLRLIGDPEARIQEDYLRLLRLFRFEAQLDGFALDPASFRAASQLAPHIVSLSAERVGHEVRKTLTGEAVVQAWLHLDEAGVLRFLLPEATSIDHLALCQRTEREASLPPSALRRLAALLPPDCPLTPIEAALRLSRQEKAALSKIMLCRRAGEKDPLVRAYRFGKNAALDAAVIEGKTSLAREIQETEVPVFPLTGQDLVDLGLVPGPAVGEVLRAVESFWIAHGFPADKAACAAEARRLINERLSETSRSV